MTADNPKKAHSIAGRHPKYLDLLAASGLSGVELARRLDVSPNTVSNWNAKRAEPPGAVLAYLDLYVRVKHLLE